MLITFKSLFGHSVDLEFESSTTIAQVKKALSVAFKDKECFSKDNYIGDSSHYHPDLIRLMYSGRMLEDAKTIEDFSIRGSSTIHVVVIRNLSVDDAKVDELYNKACNQSILTKPSNVPHQDEKIKELLQAANANPKSKIAKELLEAGLILANTKCTITETYYPYKSRRHKYELNTEKLGEAYKGVKGDALKALILQNFRTELMSTTEIEKAKEISEKLKNSEEYKVLQQGQDFITRFFPPLKTSSVKAFQKMLEEHQTNIKKLSM